MKSVKMKLEQLQTLQNIVQKGIEVLDNLPEHKQDYLQELAIENLENFGIKLATKYLKMNRIRKLETSVSFSRQVLISMQYMFQRGELVSFYKYHDCMYEAAFCLSLTIQLKQG